MKITPLVQFSLNLPQATYLRTVLERDPRGTAGNDALQFVRDAITKGLDAVTKTLGLTSLILDADDVEVVIALAEDGVFALASFLGVRSASFDEEQGVDADFTLAFSRALNETLLDLRSFGQPASAAELIGLSEEFDANAIELAQARGLDAGRDFRARREERNALLRECIERGIIDVEDLVTIE